MNRRKVQTVLTIDECYRLFWGLCRILKPSLDTDKFKIAKVVVAAAAAAY